MPPVGQENLWRPVVEEPVAHEDETVTVKYEVPAGHNERTQLVRRITPMVRLPVPSENLSACEGVETLFSLPKMIHPALMNESEFRYKNRFQLPVPLQVLTGGFSRFIPCDDSG